MLSCFLSRRLLPPRAPLPSPAQTCRRSSDHSPTPLTCRAVSRTCNVVTRACVSPPLEAVLARSSASRTFCREPVCPTHHVTLRDLCTRLSLLWCDRAIRPRSETAPERAPLPPPTDAAQTRRRRRTQTAPVLFSADQPRRPIRHAHTDIQTGAGMRRSSGERRRKRERLLGGAGTIGRDFLSDEARRSEIAHRISGLPSKSFQHLCL